MYYRKPRHATSPTDGEHVDVIVPKTDLYQKTAEICTRESSDKINQAVSLPGETTDATLKLVRANIHKGTAKGKAIGITIRIAI